MSLQGMRDVAKDKERGTTPLGEEEEVQSIRSFLMICFILICDYAYTMFV